MWVYKQPQADEHAAAPQPKAEMHKADGTVITGQTLAFSDTEKEISLPELHQKPTGKTVGLPEKHAAPSIAPRGFWVCISLYGIGLLAAGAVFAFSNGQTFRFLQFYAQNWVDLFSVGTRPLHLFSTLFLAGILSMAFLLLFGLSACGTPLIVLLLLGKGAGSGLLSLKLFLLYGWKGTILYALCPAVSDVFLAWCLCSAGQIAFQVSRRLWVNCLKKTGPDAGAGFSLLVNRCLFLCMLQILFCAASAVLSPYVATLLGV